MPSGEPVASDPEEAVEFIETIRETKDLRSAVYAHKATYCGARRNADTNSSERGQQFGGLRTVIRANVDILAAWS